MNLIPLKSLRSVRYLKSILFSQRLHLFDQKYSKSSNIVNIINILNKWFLCVLKCNLFLWIFSSYFSSLLCHMILSKPNMLLGVQLCYWNISFHYQLLLLFIIVENTIHFVFGNININSKSLLFLVINLMHPCWIKVLISFNNIVLCPHFWAVVSFCEINIYYISLSICLSSYDVYLLFCQTIMRLN